MPHGERQRKKVSDGGQRIFSIIRNNLALAQIGSFFLQNKSPAATWTATYKAVSK